MHTAKTRAAARQLLWIATTVARTAAAEMRRAHPSVAPPQMAILAQLAVEPCILSELARVQAVGLPTISKSVETLVRRGWLEREESKEDRRQTMVRVTPRGRSILATTRQRTERKVASWLARLAPAQHAEVFAALDLLAKTVAISGDEALNRASTSADAGRSARTQQSQTK